MQEKHEVSAGGIVYRRNQDNVEVALIRAGRRWGLPKGHLEPGESILDAALREVAEETGLQGDVVDKLGEITYRFMNKWTEGKPVRVFKRVHFYLIRWAKGDVQGHDYEVDEARWFPLGEALAVLCYATEKRMMRRAQALIEAEQPQPAEGFSE